MQTTSDQFAAAARLFSSSIVAELGRWGRSPLFARLARQSLIANGLRNDASVGHVFQSAFRLLMKEGYRHEYIYKSALTHKILLGTHSLRTASMLTEFRVGGCKADLAILNGTSTVYEIKSERDSLARLERQISAYSTVFASVNVICSTEHIDDVLRTVPDYVGVLHLNGRHNITTIREPKCEPERTSSAAIFDSIRVCEAKKILKLHGVPIPDVPNTQISRALRELFVQLDPVLAHESMVVTLKQSRNLLPLAELIACLPPALHSAALCTPLRKQDHGRLVDAVHTDLKTALAWG